MVDSKVNSLVSRFFFSRSLGIEITSKYCSVQCGTFYAFLFLFFLSSISQIESIGFIPLQSGSISPYYKQHMFALMYITPHLSIRVYMFQDSTCSLVDKFQFSAHVFTLIFIAQIHSAATC
jgi:hypothetical protein